MLQTEHGGRKSIPIRAAIKSYYKWLASVGERWPALSCHWINDINKMLSFLALMIIKPNPVLFFFFFLLSFSLSLLFSFVPWDLTMNFTWLLMIFWQSPSRGRALLSASLHMLFVSLVLFMALFLFKKTASSCSWSRHTHKDILTRFESRPSKKGKRNVYWEFFFFFLYYSMKAWRGEAFAVITTCGNHQRLSAFFKAAVGVSLLRVLLHIGHLGRM